MNSHSIACQPDQKLNYTNVRRSVPNTLESEFYHLPLSTFNFSLFSFNENLNRLVRFIGNMGHKNNI